MKIMWNKIKKNLRKKIAKIKKCYIIDYDMLCGGRMMKKKIIALFVVSSFFGCKNIIINNERQDCSVPERLSNIDLSETNNLTVSEMEEYLLKALQMEKENVSRAIMDENKYDLSLVQTDLIEFCTENKTERCITDNFGKVQLFLYNFQIRKKKKMVMPLLLQIQESVIFWL